ncbi:hypothetical protein Bbelb_190910 [Branchiostoma belcheri]|nr:hypothetical protein Bbelb_190910 [Branchiostoma belcheri]
MEAEEFEISILGPVSTASPSENDQTTVNHMGAEAKKQRSRAGLCSAGGYFIWYWKKRHPVVEGEVNNYDDVDYYDVVPSGSQPTVPTDDCPWNAERLPSDLQPYGYKLSLKLNLRRKQFSGSVDIRMRCKEATELIILHASLINSSGAKVEVSDLTTSENIAISEPTEYYEKNKVYVIRLIQKLTPGRIYKVSILGYTGRVRPEAPGMYKRTFRHGVRRRTFGRGEASGRVRGAKHPKGLVNGQPHTSTARYLSG